MNLDELVTTALTGEPVTREQALQILQASDADTMPIVAAAGRVRKHFFGNSIALNYLVNIKSGLCPENCSYCSQALGSAADILRYNWLSPEEIRRSVAAGIAGGASTVCLVASGRGPAKREVEKVARIVADIHRDHPQVKICTCLGFLDDEKAERLIEAGSSRYNHNLNTSRARYGSICSTHGYEDRVQTVAAATRAGLSSCSGLIAGMGESDEDLVDVVFALREIGADSVPVNFLLPFEGTPLAGRQELNPLRCLRILAMVRFVHPNTEVRSAAGREYHLRSLQPLALEICNSIFLGDYLTSEGQAGAADLAMIADLGFEVVGRIEPGGVCTGSDGERLAAVLDAAGVPLRHRGAGAPVG